MLGCIPFPFPACRHSLPAPSLNPSAHRPNSPVLRRSLPNLQAPPSLSARAANPARARCCSWSATAWSTWPRAPSRWRRGEFVSVAIDGHRVNPKLHRVLAEQIPRIGPLENVEAINHDAFVLIRGYLDAHRDEIDVADLDLAAFICVTTVEALRPHGSPASPRPSNRRESRKVCGRGRRPDRALSEKIMIGKSRHHSARNVLAMPGPCSGSCPN